MLDKSINNMLKGKFTLLPPANRVPFDETVQGFLASFICLINILPQGLSRGDNIKLMYKHEMKQVDWCDDS